MTPRQQKKILEMLESGVPADAVTSQLRMRPTALPRALADDPKFREEFEAAVARQKSEAQKLADAKNRAILETAETRVPPAVEDAQRIQGPAEPSQPAGPLASDEPPNAERWAAIRADAAGLGAGSWGHLLWVERRCVEAGMHPLDPQWLWHFREFYASGKRVDIGRFGLRGAKSISCCRAIVAEVLLGERKIEAGQTGVCPVIAQNMREADDRFSTITAVLGACGVRDVSGTRKDKEGLTFTRSGGGTTARVIETVDSWGHPVEFRVYPCTVSGAAGYTGIAGFCDEVDLWGREGQVNPAERVIEVLFTRFTTQPNARLHIMSASYNHDSDHAKRVEKGDTPLQRVARLGPAGAVKDFEARVQLAATIANCPPELTAPADPMSVDIPCWVSNPIATITTCYELAEGDVKRMLQLYGGRRSSRGGAGGGSSWTLEQLKAFSDSLDEPEVGDRPTLDGGPMRSEHDMIHRTNERAGRGGVTL
jgi:hypothetical protein